MRKLAESVDLEVIVNGSSEFDRDWKTDVGDLTVTFSRTRTRRRTIHHVQPIAFEEVVSQHIPLGLWGDLRRSRPEVIVSGELGYRSLIALAYGFLHRTPVILWSYHSLASHAGSSRVRRWLKGRILGRAKAVIGMGQQARTVLRSLGVPDGKIHDARNATDVEGLQARLDSQEHRDRVEAIKATAAPNKRLALVLGRLVPLKGVPELLAAWCALSPEIRETWELAFVGDGPYRSLVEEHEKHGVRLIGHVPYKEVADWLVAADLHVFASLGDVWGLAINESLQCATPTLSSIHAGASADMIDDGVNGLLFDPVDPEACRRGLERALGRSDLSSLGIEGRTTSRAFSIDGFAAGFLGAIHSVSHRKAHTAPRMIESTTTLEATRHHDAA